MQRLTVGEDLGEDHHVLVRVLSPDALAEGAQGPRGALRVVDLPRERQEEEAAHLVGVDTRVGWDWCQGGCVAQSGAF